MEGKEKGRGELSQSGRGTPASGSSSLWSGHGSIPRTARPIRSATHDGTANGRPAASTDRLPTRRRSARPVRTASTSRRRSAVRVRRSGLPTEPIRPGWTSLPAAAIIDQDGNGMTLGRIHEAGGWCFTALYILHLHERTCI